MCYYEVDMGKKTLGQAGFTLLELVIVVLVVIVLVLLLVFMSQP